MGEDGGGWGRMGGGWSSLKCSFRVNSSANNGNMEMGVAPLESPCQVVSSTNGFRIFPHCCDIIKGLNIIYGWVLIETKISRDSNDHLSNMPPGTWLMPMAMPIPMPMAMGMGMGTVRERERARERVIARAMARAMAMAMQMQMAMAMQMQMQMAMARARPGGDGDAKK
jgi:hypothetical protein